MPAAGASVPSGNFLVSGWFVDKTAQGWAGADDVQVFLGQAGNGGTLVAHGIVAQDRPDMAAAEGNPYFAASGFSALVAPGALPAGNQTLLVYLHTPAKGWWYKSVAVNVSGGAPASPAPASAPAPTVSGAAPPVVVIELPKASQTLSTHDQSEEIIGYALDPSAAPNQGSQGSGIDRVQVYMDGERDTNGSIYLGDATLGYSDSAAAAAYGPQFAEAGWRVTWKPTNFHQGVHTIFAYARSVLSGKENLVTQGVNITES